MLHGPCTAFVHNLVLELRGHLPRGQKKIFENFFEIFFEFFFQKSKIHQFSSTEPKFNHVWLSISALARALKYRVGDP